MNRACLLLGMSLLCSHLSAAEKSIRIVIDTAWNAPQVIYQNGQASSGILIDAFQQIANNLDAKLELISLPRKRLVSAIEHNEADLLCHINPKWLDQTIPAERWSAVFLAQENVIIQAPNRAAEPINLEQPGHLNLGTVLGFQYPKLSDSIKRGMVRRIDSPTQEVLLKNTHSGMLVYSIVNRLNADFYNRDLKPNQRLKIVQTVDIQNTYCIIAPQPRVPIAQIKAAIAKLHVEKQIDGILQRYRSE